MGRRRVRTARVSNARRPTDMPTHTLLAVFVPTQDINYWGGNVKFYLLFCFIAIDTYYEFKVNLVSKFYKEKL
jgi:hypothetical protein